MKSATLPCACFALDGANLPRSNPAAPVPDLIHLCTCGDAEVRWGLHVALSSALRALAPRVEAHVTVIDLGLATREATLLQETLQRTGRPFHLEIIPASFAPFDEMAQMRRFYGSFAPYLKLLVPAHLPHLDRVLFLDADTVVGIDLWPLYQMATEGNVAACVVENPITTALEGGYYRAAGFPEDAVFFNSGVMLLDLALWRREGLTKQCVELVRRHGAALLCADQTVLNVVLRGRYLALPAQFNRLTYPSSRAIDADATGSVWHLVGQPKPWALLGEFFNQQAPLFKRHLDRTALAGWRSYHHLSWHSLPRLVRLSRSYWKAWKTRDR